MNFRKRSGRFRGLIPWGEVGEETSRADVLNDPVPLKGIQSFGHQFPPVFLRNFRSGPTRLGKGGVKQNEVGGWPGRIGQVPDQIIKVTASGIGPRQHGMEFARQKRGFVVMKKIDSYISPNDRGLRNRSRRWIGIDLQLYRDFLFSMRGNP